MLSTANINPKIQHVPSSWIFQNYCGITEPLTGEELKIISLFKPTERTPSMVIYYDVERCKYKFNDFSTGKKGDGIDLVKYLYELDNGESTSRIIRDYENFVKYNGQFTPRAIKAAPKYQVKEWQTRLWNLDDAKFWQQFYIGSKILEYYQVKPLESYTLIRAGEQGPETVTITRPYVYGYFKRDGTLIKIYQPYNKERKFLKIDKTGYIQGSEQHGKNNPYMLLTSSMKDTMCIRSLGIKRMDMDSPDSETTGFEPLYIESIQNNYEQVIVLFDSDSTGIEAMLRYKKEYGFNFVFFNLAKDPSDAVKKLGPKRVREELIIKINQQLIPIL